MASSCLPNSGNGVRKRSSWCSVKRRGRCGRRRTSPRYDQRGFRRALRPEVVAESRTAATEIDHTLEALKVVEVMSALIACGKTILLQPNVLLKKCNGEKENNRPRGAIKISPPSYFLHSEIFSSSSSGPLPAGNSIAERHSSNVPRNQRAERGMYPFSASSSSPGVGQRRGGVSMAGSWNTRPMP